MASVAKKRTPKRKGYSRPRPWIEGGSSGLTQLYFGEMEEFELLGPEDELALGKIIRDGQDELFALAVKWAEEIPGLKTLLPLTSQWRAIERTSHASIEQLVADIQAAVDDFYEENHTLVWARRLKAEIAGIVERVNEASNRMVVANLRLAVNIAKRYTYRGLPMNDLIQEANMGLVKAVARYNYQTGFRFSTFASWWIRQTISRALYDQARTVRIPVHCQELRAKIFKTFYAMKREMGTEPTPEQIAERLGESVSKVLGAMEVVDESVSLDMPVGFDGDVLGDFLKDEFGPDPYEITRDRELVRQTVLALNGLDERERRILNLRYGLEDGEERTLEEVGRLFSLSRERIRQIEKRALGRLRQPLTQPPDQGPEQKQQST